MTPISLARKVPWNIVAWIIVGLALVIAAVVTHRQWLPQFQNLITKKTVSLENHSKHGHQHGHQDHHAHEDHHGHDPANALKLNAAAWKNIGLKTAIVKLQSYVKTVSVPAMVVERPGRSQVDITAPLTGIVTRVFPIEGEAIQPEQPLFTLRLTHEDLVTAQRNFLQSAQELDVVKREIERLELIGEGVIAGRRVVEQKYQQQRIEATLHAQRQGLLLHGLDDQQIDNVLKSRQLLPMLTVFAPPAVNQDGPDDTEHPYHVQRLLVKRGESVAAGKVLAVLANHFLLYVEGQTFEDDALRLIQAAREDWLVDVAAVMNDPVHNQTMQLKVLYVADHVDRDSRALRFYLNLPNRLIRDEKDDGHRFVAWHFRPGQRMDVKIPLSEPRNNQIVLPAEAVVQEGAEAFVFQQNYDHFDRIAVHVIFQDKDSVVVENDGQLVGSTLAMSGAYQMHLAMKSKAGSGVAPHPGHQH